MGLTEELARHRRLYAERRGKEKPDAEAAPPGDVRETARRKDWPEIQPEPWKPPVSTAIQAFADRREMPEKQESGAEETEQKPQIPRYSLDRVPDWQPPEYVESYTPLQMGRPAPEANADMRRRETPPISYAIQEEEAHVRFVPREIPFPEEAVRVDDTAAESVILLPLRSAEAEARRYPRNLDEEV